MYCSSYAVSVNWLLSLSLGNLWHHLQIWNVYIFFCSLTFAVVSVPISLARITNLFVIGTLASVLFTDNLCTFFSLVLPHYIWHGIVFVFCGLLSFLPVKKIMVCICWRETPIDEEFCIHMSQRCCVPRII